MVEGGFPVLAVIPQGMVSDPLKKMVKQLRVDQLAELVIISDDMDTLSLAAIPDTASGRDT